MGVRCSVLGGAPETAIRVVGGGGGGPGRCTAIGVTETGGAGKNGGGNVAGAGDVGDGGNARTGAPGIPPYPGNPAPGPTTGQMVAGNGGDHRCDDGGGRHGDGAVAGAGPDAGGIRTVDPGSPAPTTGQMVAATEATGCGGGAVKALACGGKIVATPVHADRPGRAEADIRARPVGRANPSVRLHRNCRHKRLPVLHDK